MRKITPVEQPKPLVDLIEQMVTPVQAYSLLP